MLWAMSRRDPKVTALAQLTDLDAKTVIESRMALRDGGRFIDAAHEQFDISADGLFRFRERAVGDA